MELQEIGEELLRSARALFEAGSFTSSSILASKAAFAFADYLLFKKTGVVVSDHKKRRDALGFNFPELLPPVNETFRVYFSAYKSRISREDAERVIEIAERIKEKAGTFA